MDGHFNIAEINLLPPASSLSRISRKLLTEKFRILESLVYQLDAVIFVHDLQTNHHIWTNGHYEKLIGFNQKEIRDMGIEESRSLFHPDDMKIILEGIDYLRSDKGNSFSCVYRMRHKLGHWVWMYYHASIMQRDEAGVPCYVLGLAVDFSSQIQSEKHLNDLIAENCRLVNHIRVNCLTKREKEIITHLTDGLSCKEISNLCGISYYTTETHIRNIYRKFGVTNLSALINLATRSGLKK